MIGAVPILLLSGLAAAMLSIRLLDALPRRAGQGAVAALVVGAFLAARGLPVLAPALATGPGSIRLGAMAAGVAAGCAFALWGRP